MRDEYVYLWAQWGVLDAQRYRMLLMRFGSLEQAWKKITPDFFYGVGMGSEKVKRIFDIREYLSFHDIVSSIQRAQACILCFDDEDYPPLLREIHNPPPFLFVRGKLPSFKKSLSVVGTRMVTDYGFAMTEKFTRSLVHNDFVIVSGLAFGVDACAHKTTLGNGGITVAVLGSGVDNIYPLSHRALAESIIKNKGALVSTYPLGTPAFKHHFPERNCIIAGLTLGTLVTEGGVGSGALITAGQALHQGREVFAVPNDLTKISLSGTHHLIRRGEAKLVETVDHILEEFGFKNSTPQPKISFTPIEEKILLLLQDGGKSIDQLLAGTEFSVSDLLIALSDLSIKKRVREEGVKWVLN